MEILFRNGIWYRTRYAEFFPPMSSEATEVYFNFRHWWSLLDTLCFNKGLVNGNKALTILLKL